MGHLVIILENHIKCVKELAVAAGNTALAALADEWLTKALALDDKLKRNQIPPLERPAAHEALEEAQNLAIEICDNNDLADRDTDVQASIVEIDEYL